MVDRYKGKYRIPSARLKNWDYGSNAPYFVTICTDNKICFFGNIKEGKMYLSDLGQLANKYWLEMEQKFPFVVLDHFIVMPNHVHGIINIDNPLSDSRDAIYRVSNSADNPDDVDNPDPIYRVSNSADNPDAINRVSTVRNIGGVTGNNNPMLHENLSRFINWYKGRCSFEMRKINTKFSWQPRFHEHVIRNEEDYLKIAEYIQNNPRKWQEDKYYASI
ncbi:transposase [Methylobacter psychrophilus]|uniref:transposase n=1 Tax=Methylobacter psychrophilus TaxID=96941 RepID=UPI0021D507EE|nr:transposase [Methylobacter psychrophilus]